MNLTEIAARWGVSVGSVLRYHISNNRLDTRRDGRSHLVLVQDLAAYEKRLIANLRKKISEDRLRIERMSMPLPSMEGDAAGRPASG